MKTSIGIMLKNLYVIATGRVYLGEYRCPAEI